MVNSKPGCSVPQWRFDDTSRNSQPIFWVPETFYPENTLPANLRRHHESAMYLMHAIIMRMSCGDEECARLKMEYLRNAMNVRQCDKIVNAMLDAGEIRRIGGYKPGSHSYGYLPGLQFQQVNLRKFQPQNQLLIRRLRDVEAKIEEESVQRIQPFHEVWRLWQSHLGIDGGEAERLIAELPSESNPYGVQTILVERIRRREHRFAVDAYGRVHNSITSLRRSIRRGLRIDGDTIGSVDIINSQPALLANIVTRHAPTTSLTTPLVSIHYDDTLFLRSLSNLTLGGGVDLYRKLATEGHLYEHLVQKTGLSRAEVKVGLLRDVFGKRGTYPSLLEQAFLESFPAVHAFVRRYNGGDNGALLRDLQRVESDLVIRRVGGRLSRVGCGPCVSLHDSVFCRRRDLPLVEVAFREELADTGFSLSLKAAA